MKQNLEYDHSNLSYGAVLSCGTEAYALQGGLVLKSVDKA